MTLYWWSCPWCGDRMAQRHKKPKVKRDRDAHIARCHPEVVRWAPHMKTVSHYAFRKVHS